MKEYGIIGKTLQHSFSPQYFNNKFSEMSLQAHFQSYELASINEFENLIQQKKLAGINVTIPYKSAIIPFLDELDQTAINIGAVNCIQTHKGLLKGFNTDLLGFNASLQSLLKPYHQKALVLGSGGASKAVQYGLQLLNIPFLVVSREAINNAIPYTQLDKKIIEEYNIIINTSPLGTFPDIHSKPDIPYQYLSDKNLLYDLVYNPAETAFLKMGLEKNAQIKNGYEMLILQAEANWQIWNE